jgi:hypothetical protein
MPIILFLRKLRRVETGLHAFPNEAPNVVLREMGAMHLAMLPGEADQDTVLRGQIERRFSSCAVLWMAKPKDALSFSGYPTRGHQHGYELNTSSVRYILTPMWNNIQNWWRSAEYLIRGIDAIVIATSGKEGGIREEQELLYSLNALERAFVINPENLDVPLLSIGLVDDLTEEGLHPLKGADPYYLGKVAVWGHWAGFESLEYARQYVAALDELWGTNLDSGKEIPCGYFAALFTALVALLAFRGELAAAAHIAQALAGAIVARSTGEKIEFLRAPDEFRRQDILAAEILAHTSKWYSANDKLYGNLTGLATLASVRN